MALLAAILSNNKVFDRCSELQPEDFYDEAHKAIFEACHSLIGEGRAADPVTVKDYLSADNRLSAVGGTPYLSRLAGAVVTLGNAPDYARTIKDRATRRQLLALAQDISDRAQVVNLGESATDLAGAYASELDRLQEGLKPGGFQQIRSMTAVELAEAAHKGSGPRPIPTGFVDLDRQLNGGFRNGQFIVLAGRPAMGKSALAMQMAFHAAKVSAAAGGRAVGFASLEMPAEQLCARILGLETGMAVSAIMTGDIDRYGASAWQKLALTPNTVDVLPLLIDDRPGQNIDMIRGAARAAARRPKGLGILFIDFLQRVRPRRGSNPSIYEHITEVSGGLADLAKELNIPVVALSQLSRECERREDKKPHMSDLRDSGSIEQDADVIAFIFRAEYYHDKERPHPSDLHAMAKWQDRKAQVEGCAEVIIEKHRNGATGSVELGFKSNLIQFTDR